MRFSSTDSQIVLDFDGLDPAVTAHRVRILATVLSAVPGVSSVQLMWNSSPRVVVAYDVKQDLKLLFRRISVALRSPQLDFSQVPSIPVALTPTVSLRASSVPVLESVGETFTGFETVSVIGSLKRGVYGGLACGSFAMSWIGLLVPGIPTVPFVILTVYFAERASPRLEKNLLNSPVIGPVMSDWRNYHAIRRSAQIQAIGFTGLLVLVTVAIAPPSPSLYLSLAAVGTIGVLMILRIPVIQDNNTAESGPEERPVILPMRMAGI